MIQHKVDEFLTAEVHGPPTKALLVWVGDVSADFRFMALRQLHAMTHRAGIARMSATGNVGGIDKRHDGFVVPHLPGAKTLSHIAVKCQLFCHG